MPVKFTKRLPGFNLRIPRYFDTETFLRSLNYKPQRDDIFIDTYPKCGTTWTQHIVQIIHRRGKPLIAAEDFFNYSPFLEMAGSETVETRPKPSSIKTHLPFEMIPFSGAAKYIYVARNPKDACVSFYHHHKTFAEGYQFQDGTMDVFFEEFIKGRVDYGDYFDHLISWYEQRYGRNILFLTYEEMKKDPAKTVVRIANFMSPEYGELIEKDPQFLSNVINYSDVNYMKEHTNRFVEEFLIRTAKNSSSIQLSKGTLEGFKGLRSPENSNRDFTFVRKGLIGDWKNYLTQEQSKRIEDRFDLKTRDTDIAQLWLHSDWRD